MKEQTMDLQQLSEENKSNARGTALARHDGTLHGRWLLIARGGWVVCALLLLGHFVISIPDYYHILFIPCTFSDSGLCNIGQLIPANFQALERLHLSIQEYAASVTAVALAASLLFWVAGILIFWHKGRDWMGLFASFVLIVLGSAGVNDQFLVLGGSPTAQMPVFMLALGLLINVVQWPALGAFLVTFPTGRFTPRWSWVIILLWLAQDGLFFLGIANGPPLLLAGEQLLVWGSTIGIQVYRYVRVYDAVQRQQTKWFVYACLIGLFLHILLGVLPGVVPVLSAPDSWYQLFNAGIAPVIIFLPIPLGIGIAILRYRLWDIDLIINRTLVYSGLSASVIGVYVLVVVYLGALLHAGYTAGISLVATGIVAVLFQPVRGLLQRGVNRLMYGERDDPYAVLTRLGSRLEATLVPEKVLPTIVETVAQALKLPYVAIALLPEQPLFTEAATQTTSALAGAGAQVPEIVAASGAPTADPLRVSLVYQAETVGYLLLAARAGDTFGKADSRLLTDLARQAGVAVYAVRLTTHLQRLSAGLQQARERLVTTREEERRRLRRDLHDGLGPQLSSQTLTLAAARKLLRQDPDAADRLLVDATTHAQEAIADIRRLVYALRPPALDDLGLLAALQEQLTQYHASGVSLILDAPECLPPLPAAVEVACYRITQEALTNVMRHASAHTCTIHFTVDTHLMLDIRDDGQGLPPAYRCGIGFTSMRERAEELGGTCTITAIPDGGTRVLACLPLA
jgi:signal transduction histidine kinase